MFSKIIYTQRTTRYRRKSFVIVVGVVVVAAVVVVVRRLEKPDVRLNYLPALRPRRLMKISINQERKDFEVQAALRI